MRHKVRQSQTRRKTTKGVGKQIKVSKTIVEEEATTKVSVGIFEEEAAWLEDVADSSMVADRSMA